MSLGSWHDPGEGVRPARLPRTNTCSVLRDEPRHHVSTRSAAGGETEWMFVPPERGAPARTAASIKSLRGKERTVSAGRPPPHRTYIGVVPPPASPRRGPSRFGARNRRLRNNASLP